MSLGTLRSQKQQRCALGTDDDMPRVTETRVSPAFPFTASSALLLLA